MNVLIEACTDISKQIKINDHQAYTKKYDNYINKENWASPNELKANLADRAQPMQQILSP